MQTSHSSGALKGVRVLEFGSYITAPYAAMLLAELGADVIKIEHPNRPDPFRSHTDDAAAPFYFAFNRNKRSLSIDYKSGVGKEAMQKLVATSDVLVINVRPGVQEKLGLDYSTLKAINPRLIHCEITGFGADGPYAKKPAFDTAGQVLSGLLSRSHQSSDPRIVGPAFSDNITGMTACMGVLGALFERAQTGLGKKVEVNMLESTLALAIEPLTHALLHGEDQAHFYRGAASQAYLLTCSDGLRLGIHISSRDKFWESLANAIERPDLIERYPTHYQRVQAYGEIGQELAAIFVTKQREEWLRILASFDLPFVPEHRLNEVHEDPQIVHLKSFAQVDVARYKTAIVPNRPIRYDGDNQSVFRPPPALGEHNEEILAELGVTIS